MRPPASNPGPAGYASWDRMGPVREVDIALLEMLRRAWALFIGNHVYTAVAPYAGHAGAPIESSFDHARRQRYRH